jgi:hypothetical protein
MVRAILATFLLLALSACSAFKMDEQARGDTEAMYAELVLGRDDALLARMTPPPNDKAKAYETLVYLRSLVPEGAGQPSELVGWRSYSGTNGQSAEITLRYRYGAAAVFFVGTFQRASSNAPWSTRGFRLNQALPEGLKFPEVGPRGAPPPPKAKPPAVPT